MTSSPVRLAGADRADQLRQMAEAELDVLVVGGGITGVGCALDAASRGLRVGIVEAEDWSSGTSSRSSKMIHGGLRYLATGDVGVVRESLRERKALQRNAAHLVRPLSMLLPVYGRGWIPWDRIKIGAGLWLYELLGHRAAAGSLHRWRSVEEVRELVPNIALESEAGGGRLRGAFHYHDASADDSRLVLSVLRTAVGLGALAVNGTRVTRLLREEARVVGVAARSDVLGDDEVELRARVVINATGVWADELLGADDTQPEDHGFRLLPSKGIHVAVRREDAGIGSGIAFFEQTGNANVFIEPWQDDIAFVGTTDAPYSGDLAAPHAEGDEIDWVLGTASQFMDRPLTRDDVVATWAGLRPLVQRARERGDDSKDVSRRHFLQSEPGLVTITGGKLTAYRAMAEDAVNVVSRQLGRNLRSTTANLALDGSRPKMSVEEGEALAQQLGIGLRQARHLGRRHGTNVEHILRLVEERPELAERVHPERNYIAAEVVWAAEYEQARNADDVLERRTRITLETREPQVARPHIEALLGDG